MLKFYFSCWIYYFLIKGQGFFFVFFLIFSLCHFILISPKSNPPVTIVQSRRNHRNDNIKWSQRQRHVAMAKPLQQQRRNHHEIPRNPQPTKKSFIWLLNNKTTIQTMSTTVNSYTLPSTSSFGPRPPTSASSPNASLTLVEQRNSIYRSVSNEPSLPMKANNGRMKANMIWSTAKEGGGEKKLILVSRKKRDQHREWGFPKGQIGKRKKKRKILTVDSKFRDI